MNVLQAVRQRRSIRTYRSDPIPDKVLDRLVQSLRWAPSSGNYQRRKFYFVFNRKLRRSLARIALDQTFIADAPLTVVACADHRIEKEYGQAGVDLFCLLDVAASIQNLGLVAHEVGEPLEYDGGTGRITNHEGANALLGRTYREGWTLNG